MKYFLCAFMYCKEFKNTKILSNIFKITEYAQKYEVGNRCMQNCKKKKEGTSIEHKMSRVHILDELRAVLSGRGTIKIAGATTIYNVRLKLVKIDMKTLFYLKKKNKI